MAGHVPRIGQKRDAGKPEGKNHLEDLSVDGEGIMDLKEKRYRA